MSVSDEQRLLDELLAADEQWNAAYHQRDPHKLAPLLAENWVGFTPDGLVVFREHILAGMAQQPPELLLFERHACRVHGQTGITRGTLYIGGQRVQSFLRVYARHEGRWESVGVQLVP